MSSFTTNELKRHLFRSGVTLQGLKSFILIFRPLLSHFEFIVCASLYVYANISYAYANTAE